MSTTTHIVKYSAPTERSGELSLFSDKNYVKSVVMSQIQSLAAGSEGGGTMEVSPSEASGVKASGTVTISGGSGAIAAVINGVSVGVTWATSDTNTAALLAAAINASGNALVSGIVTATSALGVTTITATEKSKIGNGITLSATGTGATASGARLTGGVAVVFTSYTF